MKSRIISICLCIILAAVLGACGKQTDVSEDMTPTKTAEVFLESFKAQQWDSMDQVYAGSSEEFASAYTAKDSEDEMTKALSETMTSMMYDFDYEVTGEKISDDGKTATVDIKTTTYDMVTVFNNFYQEYMEQALDKYTGKSGEMKEEDLEKMALEILQENVAKAEKTYKGEATLSLTKEGDTWIVDKIDENNSAFLNAISGGMMDVANDVVNAREGGSTESQDETGGE